MKKYPRRVWDISESDFWTSMRVPSGRGHGEQLAEAVNLGRRGQHDDAYTALMAYHRATLADEWQIIRDSFMKSPAPDPQNLQDLLNHKITVWHTHVIQFGKEIDWAPENLPSDCIHGFNYLGWFRSAVTAYIQTGDPCYRDFIIDIIDQYYGIRTHPRWDLLQQCVFGLLGVSAKWPLHLACYLALLNTDALSVRTAEQLLKTIMGFGRGLDYGLPTFKAGVNAFAVGNQALLHIARLFPECRESPKWDNKAVGYVLQQATEGFFADGGNLERVWGYGMMHLQGLTRAYDIAKRYGGLGDAEKPVLKTIRKIYQWYAKTAGPAPDYLFPTYGDAGFRNSLNMLENGERFFTKDTAPSYGVDRTKSYLLKPSGFAIMRNGDEQHSSYVNINVGSFGGWHSHWDLLSMNFWAQGEALLEEQCRFGPYANPLDVLFRAPESHNLTLIDGMVYDNRLVEGEDVAWFSNDQVDYFSAYHRAYRYFVYGKENGQVSPNIEAIIRRSVILVKDPGYVLVVDSVRDANHHVFNRAISQYWHSPFPFEAIERGVARTQGERACLLVFGHSESLHRLDIGIDFADDEVAHLGRAYNRYSLRARRWMPLDFSGNAGFTTLLYPFTGTQPRVSVRSIPTTGAVPWDVEAIEVTTPTGTDTIMLNPERRTDFTCGERIIKCRGLLQLGNERGEVMIP